MTEDQKTWWANLIFIVLFTVCMTLTVIGHIVMEIRMTPEERREADKVFYVW